MSCDIVPRVSSALALTEFHSLSPPCDHSAETPGPLIPHPGLLAAGSCIHEGFKTGSCRGLALMPRMFSASYQRYSKPEGARGAEEDAETRGRGDAERRAIKVTLRINNRIRMTPCNFIVI